MIEYVLYLDRLFFEYIILYLNPQWLTNTAEFIVNENNFKIPVLVWFALYFIKSPRRALAFLVIFAVLLGLSETIASTLKEMIGRMRPAVQMGIYHSTSAYSFPSAHALNTMAAAVFLRYWFPDSKNLFIYMSLLIGTARMLAGYHFPLDIVGGFILGYTSARVFLLILSLFERSVKAFLEKNTGYINDMPVFKQMVSNDQVRTTGLP